MTARSEFGKDRLTWAQYGARPGLNITRPELTRKTRPGLDMGPNPEFSITTRPELSTRTPSLRC